MLSGFPWRRRSKTGRKTWLPNRLQTSSAIASSMRAPASLIMPFLHPSAQRRASRKFQRRALVRSSSEYSVVKVMVCRRRASPRLSSRAPARSSRRGGRWHPRYTMWAGSPIPRWPAVLPFHLLAYLPSSYPMFPAHRSTNTLIPNFFKFYVIFLIPIMVYWAFLSCLRRPISMASAKLSNLRLR